MEVDLFFLLQVGGGSEVKQDVPFVGSFAGPEAHFNLDRPPSRKLTFCLPQKL